MAGLPLGAGGLGGRLHPRAAVASVPSAFTHYDPIAIDNAVKLRPPSAEHWFGTDLLGRDLYARIVYGARASLLGASIAVGVAVVIGSVLGAVAGWFGGLGDTVLMRLIDVLLSIPGFLLAIAIVVLYTAKTATRVWFLRRSR